MLRADQKPIRTTDVDASTRLADHHDYTMLSKWQTHIVLIGIRSLSANLVYSYEYRFPQTKHL